MNTTRTIIAIFALVFCLACEQPVCNMTVTGVVREMATQYETGATASNVEVKLFTYEEPELPQLPPLGNAVASTTTDKGGRYKFEIGLETLPKNCDKLVVFVDRGYKGWKVVAVGEGVIQVDLATGSIPLPAR